MISSTTEIITLCGPLGPEPSRSGLTAFVRVADPGVWPEHCRVVRNGDELSIEDLAPLSMGTYIKRHGATQWQRIATGNPRALGPGDQVKIGRTIIPYTANGG